MTPPANWMNDPNGLIKIDDTFHLFYQHNPTANRWGNLHWGHASSTDLLRWDHHPIALAPDDHGQAFSGTVVADDTGSAGFGAGALVAVFTQDLDGFQRQSLASSTDGGMTWQMFSGNPVLDAPEGVHDFRDPKVLRYESEQGSWWVMVLAVGAEIWIYRSEDLRSWQQCSAFAVPTQGEGSILEVPELVRLPVEGTGESIWVLLVSIIPPGGARRLAGRTRWIAVDFDGERLTAHDADRGSTFDAGCDFYAPMVWDGGPCDPTICVGWMNEWGFVGPDRDTEWCGRMSMPRRLTLVRSRGQLRLRQPPVVDAPNDPAWRGATLMNSPDLRGLVDNRCFAIWVRCDLDDATGVVEIEFAPEDADAESKIIRIDAEGLRLGQDGECICAEQEEQDGSWIREVLVIVDAGSIEVFVDDGLGAASEICGLGFGATAVSLHLAGSASVAAASVFVPSPNGSFTEPAS